MHVEHSPLEHRGLVDYAHGKNRQDLALVSLVVHTICLMYRRNSKIGHDAGSQQRVTQGSNDNLAWLTLVFLESFIFFKADK